MLPRYTLGRPDPTGPHLCPCFCCIRAPMGCRRSHTMPDPSPCRPVRCPGPAPGTVEMSLDADRPCAGPPRRLRSGVRSACRPSRKPGHLAPSLGSPVGLPTGVRRATPAPSLGSPDRWPPSPTPRTHPPATEDPSEVDREKPDASDAVRNVGRGDRRARPGRTPRPLARPSRSSSSSPHSSSAPAWLSLPNGSLIFG